MLDLLGELAERGVDGLLELLGGDGDVEPDLVALERFDRRGERHGAAQSIACSPRTDTGTTPGDGGRPAPGPAAATDAGPGQAVTGRARPRPSCARFGLYW